MRSLFSAILIGLLSINIASAQVISGGGSSNSMAKDASNATQPTATNNLLGTPTLNNCVIGNGTSWASSPCPGGSGSGVPGGATNSVQTNAGAGSFAGTSLTNGQLLIGSTGAAPVPATITAGSNITVTNGAGSITIASTGGVAAFPQGRLTLTSGSPVMSSDVTGATTVYYDCMVGNQVPVGTTLANLTITSCEVSNGLAAANVLSGNVYDEFAVSSGGSLATCVGPAWSSTTSRGTGAGTTQIDQTNGGIWTNTNSLTHCWGGAAGTTDFGPIAAHAATYLGSLYATAAGQTSMQFAPAAAVGGTNNVLGLYNAYNRCPIESLSADSTSSWTYATSVWRPANNSTSNRISWLDGLGQSKASASYYTVFFGGNAANGVNFNNTTATPSGLSGQGLFSAGTGEGQIAGRQSMTGMGLNFAQAMEFRSSGTITFVGLAGTGGQTTGIVLNVEM